MAAILLHICLIFSVFIPTSESQKQVRNVITGRNREWRRGDVIYRFSSLFDNSQRQIITEAMQEIMNDTSYHSDNCVRFLPREGVYSSVDDFVYFTDSPDSGCSVPSVGRKGGQQDVLIGSDCMTKTGIMPLLLLTLGLYREHQRPDRDQYIDVHYTNIKKEDQPFFDKIDPASTDLLGLQYDYNSITHFGPYAYAVNPQEPTITANFSFGNKRKLSVSDVEKVQQLYNCGIDTSHIKGIPEHFQIDCTFENPVCGLVNSIKTSALWSKSKNNILVDGDHTRGSGHFMYSNSNGTQLLTLRYIKTGLFCIQLAVFRSDSNTYLDLHAELPDSSVTISNTTQCTDVGRWAEYEMSVNASTYWRLIIEARVGLKSNGTAVDDVSVTEGYCLENWCKSSPITLM